MSKPKRPQNACSRLRRARVAELEHGLVRNRSERLHAGAFTMISLNPGSNGCVQSSINPRSVCIFGTYPETLFDPRTGLARTIREVEAVA